MNVGCVMNSNWKPGHSRGSVVFTDFFRGSRGTISHRIHWHDSSLLFVYHIFLVLFLYCGVHEGPLVILVLKSLQDMIHTCQDLKQNLLIFVKSW